MARLTFARLRQALTRGAVDPIYLLVGEEAWFHDEALALLEGSALDPKAAGINREAFRGPGTSLHEIVDLASTYPMGPGRRLVVVREADGLRPEGLEALKDYVASPNPRTCLVFSDASFDQRRSFFKTLAAGATVVECAPLPDESAVAAWARDRLQSRGYGLSPELAEAIGAGLAGAGLQRLDAELQKLMSAIGSPRPVQAADLAILAEVPRVGDAFQAARQALRGDRGAAIAGLRALLEAGEEGPMVLGAFAWYARTALKAKAASDRRTAPRELPALYALKPGQVERMRDEIGPVPEATLREAVRLCLETDRGIKGGGAKDPANAFERMVHRLARSRARRKK
jgi:DNA polymerase-3 subunit delta